MRTKSPIAAFFLSPLLAVVLAAASEVVYLTTSGHGTAGTVSIVSLILSIVVLLIHATNTMSGPPNPGFVKRLWCDELETRIEALRDRRAKFYRRPGPLGAQLGVSLKPTYDIDHEAEAALDFAKRSSPLSFAAHEDALMTTFARTHAKLHRAEGMLQSLGA